MLLKLQFGEYKIVHFAQTMAKSSCFYVKKEGKRKKCLKDKLKIKINGRSFHFTYKNSVFYFTGYFPWLPAT